MMYPEVAHHGDATLTIELHDGAFECVLDVDHALMLDGEPRKLRMTEAQARAAAHCFADLFPYSYTHPPNLLPAVDELRVGMRVCQHCSAKPAEVFDLDGAWCSTKCRALDEAAWRRKAVGG